MKPSKPSSEIQLMTKRDRALQEFIDHNNLTIHTTVVTTDRRTSFTSYVGYGGRMIYVIHYMSRHDEDQGWDILVPVSAHNTTELTLLAAQRYLDGKETGNEHQQ